LDCVFHVVLPKAPPFRAGLITQCNETEPKTASNPQTYGDTVTTQRWRQYSTTYFVIVQDEESALAEAAAATEAAKAQAAELQKKVEDDKKAIAEANQQRDRALQSVKTLELTNKSVGNERDTLRETNKKMEADLAKLRKAIGELQFKEIVG
jgi:septal ring factor EnvC (AmiA/AmiB activator)